MKFDTAPFRNWFGYSRRERRSSFILLLLILLVISVRFLYPEKNLSLEYFPVEIKDDSGVPGMTDALPVQAAEDKAAIRIARSKAMQKGTKLNININSCDTAELIKLPGIGPVLSVRIIKYRNLLGGFVNVNQLREVYGLPPETYERIKDQIYVDTLMISRIKINSADFKTLIRFPYFEKVEVTSILKYRELEGRVSSIKELVDNKLISEEKAMKVRPYLRFE